MAINLYCDPHTSLPSFSVWSDGILVGVDIVPLADVYQYLDAVDGFSHCIVEDQQVYMDRTRRVRSGSNPQSLIKLAHAAGEVMASAKIFAENPAGCEYIMPGMWKGVVPKPKSGKPFETYGIHVKLERTLDKASLSTYKEAVSMCTARGRKLDVCDAVGIGAWHELETWDRYRSRP